jgi:serine/threonine protein kinase
MEYLNGGSIDDLIKTNNQAGKKMNTIDASRIIKLILEAVIYIHNYDTAHRDLKPGNYKMTIKKT